MAPTFRPICPALLAGAVRGTEVRDITDDPARMAESRELLLQAYRPLMNGSASAFPSRLAEVVCDDEYARCGRTRTIATLTENREGGLTEVSCTIRVLLGEDNSSVHFPALEAMRFVVAQPDWPHRLAGVPDGMTAEFGRFVIHRRYRTTPMKAAGVHAFLTRRLYDCCLDTMSKRGTSALYAVMPTYMAGLCVRAGLEISELPFRLRTEDHEAAKVFQEFSTYWVANRPKLYRFEPLYV